LYNSFLEVKNLTQSFNTSTILNKINFQITNENIIAILGESGEGKSTLLKSINGLIPFSDGQIIFKGIDIHNYNPLSLRKTISYIPQIPVSIADNVLEEFKLVKKDITIEQIKEIFESFKLDSDILQQKMSKLSIGQQQRLALLRGMLNYPELILFDEPTSALDESNIKLLEQIITNLNIERKIRFIIVTHNILFAKNICEKFFTIKNGTLNET